MALLRMVSKLRGGPRISPARRAKLEELGFNTDMPLFRGTTFDIGKEIEAGRALHVSDSPHYASAYAAGFDNPFDYHPSRQELTAASMSREAHEKLRDEVEAEARAAYDVVNKPGMLGRLDAGQEWDNPARRKNMLELVKVSKGLPANWDQFWKEYPHPEAWDRPGANFTADDFKAMQKRMAEVEDEVVAKMDELSAAAKTPEWHAIRDAYDNQQRLQYKWMDVAGDRLSATPHVAPLYARVKNPRPIVDEMGIVDLHEDPDRVKDLMKKGYDSAIWTPEAETRKEVLEEFGGLANNIHGGEMVVFKPEEQLTGAFADFVPLLKKYGLPITGAGVATLASMLNQRQPEMA